MYDIGIIGGGASGMTAAIAAAMENRELKICIIEKMREPGRKLRATGNGKCNISNAQCSRVDETIEFFNKLGVFLVTEEGGWMYPASRQGEDVLFAIEEAIKSHNINIIANQTVQSVEKRDGLFSIDGEQKCRNLLLATGGKAGPQFGSTGDGYRIAKSFGHKITKLYPVLTALESMELKGLKGVRGRGKVTLLFRGEPIAWESGEIQFTHDGVSGICIFNLSRFVRLEKGITFSDYELMVDFFPERSLHEMAEIIRMREERGLHPLRSMVSSKLCQVMLQRGNTPLQLAEQLKSFLIKITGAKGWKSAQCTGGGVEESEVQEETKESKLIEGLFFAGEILNYDGPCGGFNLQNAWETGIEAGRAMAARGKL